ncbi:PA0069 family radical SAM protein [Tahibacter caeni]|uniref:PA0069 family radical SAM protein n=1 Tax=Tahibacter caeni TaxID=1453545 RepID=UPI002147C8B0|nr:PA0069 family radical SAM protein [Tahibacter caeni]
MSDLHKPERIKGRGSRVNPAGRFEVTTHEAVDDGWYQDGEPVAPPRTTVIEERARHIVTQNASPDIPFDASINPYRGCEHGCAYCYARPSHAYLNLSPGLDFETRLFAKTNAAAVLRQDLARRGYRCSAINIGANTDCYQPIEKRYRVTRQVLEVLSACHHPCTIITKNSLIERDIDLLADMAARRLVHVFVSVTSLDNRLSSRLEPRASAPHRRLQTIAALSAAGIPTSVNVAPIIPALTDIWIEAIVERAAAAGARSAGYTVLRLPWELKQLWEDWLAIHYPERKQHVLNVLREIRGGELNEPRFGLRMRGEGPYADLIRNRLTLACKKYGIRRRAEVDLDTSRFVPPRPASPQGELFG